MALLRAKTSFRASERRIVHAGDLLDAADPVIKGREGLFEDPDQAHKAPEVRQVGTSRAVAEAAPDAGPAEVKPQRKAK
ncbi:MAG TPA: hypothetical protein VFU14_20160 [Acidimicrobiales bacterium]|nr:hypothetical protein [Acidimicrobiales bacterium]